MRNKREVHGFMIAVVMVLSTIVNANAENQSSDEKNKRASNVAVEGESSKLLPYVEEEVLFNAGGGVTLAGTLTFPEGSGSFPAVLFVAGSGPQDRDETYGQHKPLRLLADYLTRRGIATLRYDKRGVGESGGNGRFSTYEDFMKDALGGIKYLKHRRNIKAQSIGVVGTSEGGLLSYMMAARSKDVAFIVMMGSPGLDGTRSLFLQHALVWRMNGMSDRGVSIQVNMEKDAIEAIKSEKDDAQALTKVKQIVESYVARMTIEDKKELQTTIDTVNNWGGVLTEPYWRYSTKYDPRKDLLKVKCPVLAMFGEKDLLVPPKENGKAIEAALNEGKNPDFTVKEFPGLNHVFQTSKTGAPSEFVSNPETIAPVVLESLGDWIEKHVK